VGRGIGGLVNLSVVQVSFAWRAENDYDVMQFWSGVGVGAKSVVSAQGTGMNDDKIQLMLNF
jgi:hypothetical protein